MINFETYHEVRRLNRELKLTPAQIAEKTGLNIKTIRKWLDKPRYEPRSKGVPRHGISWERGRLSGALFRGNWRVGHGVI